MTETLSASLPTDLEDRIAGVLRRSCAADLRIATAESCTGGLLASVLTDVEGFSHAFTCAFITYTDGSKTRLLGVPADLIQSVGAVSRPVALAMAKGALDRSDADLAVAITGFAGPGAADDEEGRVHLALAGPRDLLIEEVRHFGPIGRGGIRVATLDVAIGMLEAALPDAIAEVAIPS